MGDAAEFPERSSSPLKRRASSMDPDVAPQQDATEDVDMANCPPPGPTSGALDVSASEPSSSSMELMDVSPDPPSDEQTTSVAQEDVQPVDTSSGPQLPLPSIRHHVKEIRRLYTKQETEPLTNGQVCYLVSNSWFGCVPDDLSPKVTDEDFAKVPPVDNTDIIREVIDDPCIGVGIEESLRRFVRLKQGYDQSQFTPFPPQAWELLKQWPGLKDGQPAIRREAHSTVDNDKHVMWEWHPPVLTIHRLWSANSALPIDSALKARDPPPVKLVRYRTTRFQTLLIQAKSVTDIELSHRVRVWKAQPTAVGARDKTGLTFPTTSTPPEAWNHLLLDVESFLALSKPQRERELVDFGDLTNTGQKSGKTLKSFGIEQDQAIVLDLHEGGSTWTSTIVSSHAKAALPSRSTSNNLVVQNRSAKSGRISPISQGPLTRGRLQKPGRVSGCVGLGNLGNTCYMNAALQCVKSVEELTKYFLSGEWEHELNRENVLSHNGDVAASYAQLLKEIYKEPIPFSISPRQFKNTIGKCAPSFSGYNQQDTQEFLGFLLDGLQEDLSRIKKKPYIEKPDSTDEMVNDPNAIRQMAEEVWSITKKRDDSVISDLFTGLYKSTLVCPTCEKVSITFDPFNNLTLPLPVESKWTHTVKFFPLNDRPVDIRVEVDKQASFKSLKVFLSARTGVPIERLFGAEEWKGKFYKIYADMACPAEEIGQGDNAWFYELEAEPTNFGIQPNKRQKLGVAVRSMIDEVENNTEESAPWEDERIKRLLVPVFHRRPADSNDFHSNHSPQRTWQSACVPHFIVVTPEEARSADAIRRKILEKVTTLTKNSFVSRVEESDGSDSTEPELIGMGGSDAGSSSEGRVVAQSVKGEDDMVDVQMKDASDTNSGIRSIPPVTQQFCHKRPSWVDPNHFLPPSLQNMFDLCFMSESGISLPTGFNTVNDDKEYPRLALRIPPESSSEDQGDDTTNSTTSNEDNSADEAPRQSTGQSVTRMNDESEEEDAIPVIKPIPQHPKSGKHAKAKTNRQQKPIKNKYGKGSRKKGRSQQHRQARDKRHIQQTNLFKADDVAPDGGPLIRLGEGIVVDWVEHAYDNVFYNNGIHSITSSLKTWEICELLPDRDLDRAQAARAKRQQNGISLEDCLNEFEREEILSEQDMWYCPRCKEHRRASKKFDLWKTPDILIIHLKRFSSTGIRRDKLEVVVDFPLEDLDITSRVLNKENGKQEIYDLIGVDCHWGGLGGGHYTAHAKNFVDGKWYSYNDASVTAASPNKIVDSSAYLLFYRRRSEKPLGGPLLQQISEKFADNNSSSSDQPDAGEDEPLGEGFSQNGSSSGSQGAEGPSEQEKSDGKSSMYFMLNSNLLTSTNDWSLRDARSVDDDVIANTSKGLQPSIEGDEGIDLAEDTDTTRSTGFQPLTNRNNWNFDNLGSEEGADLEGVPSGSPFGSGAASDEAQHDSSGDERVLSPREMEFNLEIDAYPGMLNYKLPAQPQYNPPSYNEPPPPEYQGEMTPDDEQPYWDHSQKVHEVPPQGETEEGSDDAAEIHLDDNDKLKL
ncbi:UCH-domain-containing protein [Hypoxylon sp. NC1633]|nr:UCH-domain-containing protein [Hypoxylon sp. NC1633]